MSRVVVPVAVLQNETVSTGLITLLGTVDVTVLGYHQVPDQTSPDQARDQFESRARAALEDVTQEFRQAGGDADYQLVFTPNRIKTLRRITTAVNARAVAVNGPTGDVDRLLVSLTGTVDTDRILEFVIEVIGPRDIGVTLFAAGNETEDADSSLEDAADGLRDAGIDTHVRRGSGRPFGALVEAASDHDVVVMGERAPSLRSVLFGDEAERVAAESVGPVLVVRTTE